MNINTNDNKYVFGFAIAVCLVCSILLSAVTESLRKPQEINADLEIKKNILKAVKISTPITPKMKAAEILQVYSENIEELVIDREGKIVPGKTPQDLGDQDKDLLPLYVYKSGEKIKAYAYPIVGQGLWSTLYGYLALEADATTIRGITFYKHGETPGLGAEIEKDWFQDNFVGKTVYSAQDRKLTPIIVAKGKAADSYQGDDLNYRVDGITAATLTCLGVTEMMEKWVNMYEPYFSKARKI